MHNFRSLSGRPLLHALVLASALLLAGGLLSLMVPRMATAQTAPAFTSDRLSVEVLGAGPDVIFIPGYASSREVWRAEAERLSATHRVHMVQLAGFAGEPWVHGDGPFVQPVIDELARYIDEAGLEAPAVIGHSMGGMSALILAQQYPALVGKVMSVDSLPFFSALFGPQVTVDAARPFAEQAAAGTLAADDASFRAGQVQGAAGYVNDPATQAAMVEWGMASDRQALATAIKEVMLTDLRPALPAMTTPVWAVYAADANGGASPAMADALWQREYATLPGVTLIRVDDSRHFVMADQPERFSEIVDRFLAE
ncbi:MAG: alpha/beta hydrolase [Brevundimonas sp.]|uniref:alpha/beta fold hydrolase n=1 Tax=Brevundimonas sp. TaxID=1871086 RepID=UPI002773680D|nr:alpha/beta hydrolase [Brevundimonas sp.]MDP3400878.1 alpha/beta hydrolase [Brevundimonas sp.]MDZ4108267.1 alpha/beta hydrolase [Brevundimonas sp.]